MPYTKSLNEIAQIIKSKPGYVIKHANGYDLIVNDVDLDSEKYVISCLKPDKNGEFKPTSFQLSTIYENQLAFDDGVFVSDSEPKGNEIPITNFKSVPATSDMTAPTIMPISEHPAVEKALESIKTVSANGVVFTKAKTTVHAPGAVHFGDLRELGDAMDAGDHGKQYSWHFWQITECHNAVNILKTQFLSRNKLNGKMPSDALLCNPDTKEVMNKNVSKAVTGFCRFHLRPRTDFTKAYIGNYKGCDVRSFVYFSVSRKKIFNDMLYHRFDKPVLLTPYCAGSMSWEALSWKNQINFKKNLSALDFSGFNWENIYSRYDPTDPKYIKQTQRAEALIADSLGLEYIDAIYFVDSVALERFAELLPAEVLKRFEPLFKIEPDLFFPRRSISECL